MASPDGGPERDDARRGGARPAARLGLFLAELRRRGVTRAVMGYAVVAFALLQTTEPVLHGLHLPDWLLTATVVLLAAGFPIVVAVSWSYDLTRRGLVRDDALPSFQASTADAAVPSQPVAHPPPRASRWPPLTLVVAGVLLGAGLAAMALWRPARPLLGRSGEPVIVAVADFANETLDPELDGLSEMLVGWLEQSRTLRVLTRGRLATLVRETGKKPGRIDEELAREVGRKAGVQVLLLASIRKLGESYAVELRGVDPSKDDYLFAIPERAATKGDLFQVLERLSDRVRERIAERPADIQATRVQVEPATLSFEAWQLYYQGAQQEEAYHVTEALTLYRKAAEADPGFALAHYRIALLGEYMDIPRAERTGAMDAALRHLGSLPAKEQMLVQGWKAHMDGNTTEAHRLYDLAAATFPTDKYVVFEAAHLYFREERWEQALPLFRRANALDPSWQPAIDYLFNCLDALGMADEAQSLARAWVERAPSAIAWARYALALGMVGRHEEAIAAGKRATELDDRPVTRLSWGQALLLAERYVEAEQVFRSFAGKERPGEMPWSHGLLNLAGALAYQGRLREAFQVEGSIKPSPEWSTSQRDFQRILLFYCVSCRPPPGELQRLARSVSESGFFLRVWLPLHLLFHGDRGLAAEIAAGLQAEELSSDGLKHYRALLAWRSGEKQRAISELEALSRRGWLSYRPAATWLLVVAAHEDGRDRDLLARIDELARTPSNLWRSVAYPEAVLWAARAHERLGQREQARARIEKLLGFWKKADPDLPLLAEARAFCRQVGCRAP